MGGSYIKASREDLVMKLSEKLIAPLIYVFLGFLMVPGQQSVIIYKSPQAFREAVAIYDANNKRVTPAYIARTAALVPGNTEADLLECSWSYGLDKVMITKGKFEGVIGWVPIEWYHSK